MPAMLVARTHERSEGRDEQQCSPPRESEAAELLLKRADRNKRFFCASKKGNEGLVRTCLCAFGPLGLAGGGTLYARPYPRFARALALPTSLASAIHPPDCSP